MALLEEGKLIVKVEVGKGLLFHYISNVKVKMSKKSNKITIRSSAAEYLTYVASIGDETQNIEVRYEDENIWLTQKMLGMLFDVESHTINYHIKNIFSDSELAEDSVTRKFRITADDGKTYDTKHYNLQMIIAVGFKVNSGKTVQSRKWVNQIAPECTILIFAIVEHLGHGVPIIVRDYGEKAYEFLKSFITINIPPIEQALMRTTQNKKYWF